MRAYYNIFLAFAFAAISGVHAQENGYRGVLMKARLDGKEFQEVNPPAEMKYSCNGTGASSSLYFVNTLSAGGNSYYLGMAESYSPFPYEHFSISALFISEASEPNEFISEIYSIAMSEMDVISPYLKLKPRIIPSNGGIWIISGDVGSVFITNKGEVKKFQYENSDSTLGLKIYELTEFEGSKYFGVFGNIDAFDEYEYYLINIEESPYIDSITAKRVYFPAEDEYVYNYPARLFFLQDSLYLEVEAQGFVNMLTLKDSVFTIIKRFQDIGSDISAYRNNCFYAADTWGNLLKYEYDSIKCVINFSDTLISTKGFSSTAYGQQLKYGVFIKGDSAYIYDVDNESIINAIYTPGIRTAKHPFIDSEYVYIHAITEVIGAEEEPNITLSYKLSAYPNPFNPQTTIAFTLANSGKVELAVYDLLGRKVTELLNEYKDKGSYEVKFNGSNLASGIYLYTIKAGNFVKTEKLILLK